jgi:hypothetical protein
LTGLDLVVGLQAYDHPIESVFVIVGNGDTPYEVTPYPTLYTNGKRPHGNDLENLEGLDVQLIHGEGATDEAFAKWVMVAMNAKPNTLIFMDSEKEIYSHDA